MARNTAPFTATYGRDKGKKFIIKEMSAFGLEEWSLRALLAIMRNNPGMPDGFEAMGAAGMVQVGLRALQQLQWVEAQPLLAQMMDCVSVVPDSGRPNFTRPLNTEEDDIEELKTIEDLRAEWWTLHMGFFMAALPSLVSRAKDAIAAKTPRLNTQTQPS